MNEKIIIPFDIPDELRTKLGMIYQTSHAQCLELVLSLADPRLTQLEEALRGHVDGASFASFAAPLATIAARIRVQVLLQLTLPLYYYGTLPASGESLTATEIAMLDSSMRARMARRFK